MQEEKLAEERTKKREGAPKGQDAAPVNWQPEIEIGTDTLMKADGPLGAEDGVWSLQLPKGMKVEDVLVLVIAEAISHGNRVLFLPVQKDGLDLVGETLKCGELSPWYLCIGEKDGKALSGKLKSAIATVGQGKEAVRTAGNGTLPGAITEWLRILYQRRRCGWPLRELLLRYETYRDAPDGMTFSLEQISGVDAKTINAWNDLVVRLVSAAQAVGHPSGHPLSGIGQTQYSQHLRVHAPQSLVLYREALEQVKQRAAALCRMMGEPEPRTRTELERLYAFSTILVEMKPLPARWISAPDLAGFLRVLREMIIHGKRERELFSLLSRDWLQDFLRQDGAMLAAAWEKSCGKWSVSRNVEQKRILKHLAPYARQPMEKDKVGPALEALRTYQAENDMVVKLFSECRELLTGLYQENYTDWSVLERLCVQAQECNARMEAAGCTPLRRRCTEVDWKTVQAFAGTWRTFSEMQSGVYRLFQTADQKAEETETYLEAQQRMCDVWRNALADLQPWTQWRAVCLEACAAGLGMVVHAYEGGCPHAQVVPAYEKALFRALIEDSVRGEPLTGSFSSAGIETIVMELQGKISDCHSELVKARACGMRSLVAANWDQLNQQERALVSDFADTETLIPPFAAVNALACLFPCVSIVPGTVLTGTKPERPIFDLAIVEVAEAAEISDPKSLGTLGKRALLFQWNGDAQIV